MIRVDVRVFGGQCWAPDCGPPRCGLLLRLLRAPALPGLRDKPAGVPGNQGACVVAESFEMKLTCVKSGGAIWDTHKLCPDATSVKRDFYR